MKKKILAIALLATLSLAVNAQDMKPGKGKMKNMEGQAKHNGDKIAKELGLTDEQKTKWEAAAKERMTANLPLREKLKGATTPEERKSLRTQAKANNDKFDASVNTFLTPEQKAKFEEMKKAKMAAAKAKMKPGAKADDAQELLED
jgi:Spy/CpxP family protein refolding chaperone